MLTQNVIVLSVKFQSKHVPARIKWELWDFKLIIGGRTRPLGFFGEPLRQSV